MKKTSITLLLVLSLLVAGCASLGGSSNQTTSKTATIDNSTETVASTTASTTKAGDGTTESSSETTTTGQTTTATTTTQSATTTTTTADTTTESSWSAPKSPNTPLQNKIEEDGNKMKSVSVVNTKEASGGGYSDFDLKVSADTEMHRIDPAEHGTVNGEPFFLVYVDGSIDNGSRFTDASGTLIERSDVSRDENGEFTIDVRPGGLKEAGAEDGKVKIMVLLMDKDSDWDDIYGVSWVTVDYSSGE